MLNGSNTYGFLKCRYGSEESMKSMATSFFGKQMMRSMFDRLTKGNQSGSNANTSNQTTP
jgi:hypothetical protein